MFNLRAVLARPWRLFCREWLWIAIVTIGVSSVALFNLLGADPRFQAVWLYTPQAIPTLAFVDAILDHQPVRVSGNHATWMSVWLLRHISASPVGIIIMMYIAATVSTAVAGYVLFRARHISVIWSVIGAMTFSLLPSRFEMHVLAMHWWLALPMVMWWVLAWWDGMRIHHARWNSYDWIAAFATVFIMSIFGPVMWWWSSVVLLTGAMVASITYRTWRPVASAGSMASMAWGLLTVLHQIWPIPQAIGDDGVRLSTLWVPPAGHRIAWFAQRGFDFDTLDVVHTDATYIGIFALIGIGIIIGQTLMQSVRIGPVTTPHRMMVIVGVIVIIANQRGLLLLSQFGGGAPVSTAFVDVWIGFIGITTLLILLDHLRLRRNARWVVALMCVFVFIDQVPHTNMLYQMMRRQIEIPVTTTWRDGIWFGQAKQARDVRSITGVSDIERGYGRWSDASQAEYVEITLDQPITAPVSLAIRARGVGVNVGAPVIVQIGDEQQSIVLTGAVAEYQVSFVRANGSTIRVYPQPVAEPPPGDMRRIGVLLQSIQVINP